METRPELSDTEIEHALNFESVDKLLRFKQAYGEHWRGIALHLISMNAAREKLDAITSARPASAFGHQGRGRQLGAPLLQGVRHTDRIPH